MQGIGIGHPAVCGEEKFPVRIGNAADIRNIGGSRFRVAVIAFHEESENARTVHGKRFFSRAYAGGGIREFQGRASRFFDAQHSVGRGVRQKDGLPVHGNVRGVLGKPVHAVAVTRDLVACKLFAVRVKGADAVFVNEINAPRIADPREFVPVHAFHAKFGIAALPIEVSLHGKIITPVGGKRKGCYVVFRVRVGGTGVSVCGVNVLVPGKIDGPVLLGKGRGDVARLTPRRDVPASVGRGYDVAPTHLRIENAVLRIGKIYVRSADDKGRAGLDLRLRRLVGGRTVDPQNRVASAHVRRKVQERLSAFLVKVEGGDAVRVRLCIGGIALFLFVIQPDLVPVRNGHVISVFRNVRRILQIQVLLVRFGQKQLRADALHRRRIYEVVKAEQARQNGRRGK